MASKKNFNKSRIHQLLVAYVSNNISQADFTELMDDVEAAKHNEELGTFMQQVWDAQPVSQSFTETESAIMYRQILDDQRFNTSVKRKIPLYKMWYGIAASFILISLTAVLLFRYASNPSGSIFSKNQIMNDVAPGSNKAILTLGDGSKVVLTGQPNDSIMKKAGYLVKAANGELIYEKSTRPLTQVLYNAIETPRGGQYQVVLQDGTRVWLNSASVLRYPENFVGQKNRLVELTGEAYFEVAHNGKQPFIVKTPQQEVTVLGTHFNINSYTDETETKTTLLQGAVRVANTGDKNAGNNLTLVPGQQAVLKGNLLSLHLVDTDAETAWKNGYFIFKNEDLSSIMRKIARWYDLDVVYHEDITAKRYEGSVSRFKNVAEVLRIFELTNGIHFKLEGRRLTVMP